MEKNLISDVTEEGLLIPKEWLIGIEKVELFKKNNIITVTPVEKNDPIFQLGTKPVPCGVTDGSEKHDSYIYG
ncbi:MAG: hypothetical protein GY795_26995 [Desulfobacterales bacterium]|nr:hypothetical protein [Desulfobacterales bacterium]